MDTDFVPNENPTKSGRRKKKKEKKDKNLVRDFLNEFHSSNVFTLIGSLCLCCPLSNGCCNI